MNTADSHFLQALKQQAKEQAVLEQSSPLPEWARPLASVVGLHYWQTLLILSFLLAVPVSTAFFPIIYRIVVGG